MGIYSKIGMVQHKIAMLQQKREKDMAEAVAEEMLSEVERLRAKLELTEAKLRLAKADHQWTTSSEFGTAEDMCQAEANYRMAKAEVERLEEELE